MKKTIHSVIMVAAMTVTFGFSANAQVKYADGRLSVDTAPYSNYKVTVGGNGIYLKNPSNSSFFQMDISSSNTRLAGCNDQVVFYNSSTNRYNSIVVQNVMYQSDARTKTDIRDFGGGLSIISRLRPVTYHFLNSDRSMYRQTGKETGLLAQEVEAIYPDAVATDANGTKLINYNALIPVLIDAVKALQSEVEALKGGR